MEHYKINLVVNIKKKQNINNFIKILNIYTQYFVQSHKMNSETQLFLQTSLYLQWRFRPACVCVVCLVFTARSTKTLCYFGQMAKTDQDAGMHRLIRVFTERTCDFNDYLFTKLLK